MHSDVEINAYITYFKPLHQTEFNYKISLMNDRI